MNSIIIAIIPVCTVVYCFFVGGNLMAIRQMDKNPSMQTLVRCVQMDKFEWADYALSYVASVSAQGDNVNRYVRLQADEYAERLAALDSNSIPSYLAEYYFGSDRPEQGIAMLEKYVDYVSSDQNAWLEAFALLRKYADGSETFRSGVARIVQKLESWNAENMGDIKLDAETEEFIKGYL